MNLDCVATSSISLVISITKTENPVLSWVEGTINRYFDKLSMNLTKSNLFILPVKHFDICTEQSRSKLSAALLKSAFVNPCSVFIAHLFYRLACLKISPG